MVDTLTRGVIPITMPLCLYVLSAEAPVIAAVAANYAALVSLMYLLNAARSIRLAVFASLTVTGPSPASPRPWVSLSKVSAIYSSALAYLPALQRLRE